MRETNEERRWPSQKEERPSPLKGEPKEKKNRNTGIKEIKKKKIGPDCRAKRFEESTGQEGTAKKVSGQARMAGGN